MHSHPYEGKKAHIEKPGSSGYHLMGKRHAGGGGVPVAPATATTPPANPSPYKKGGRPKFERRAAGGAAKVRRDFPYTHHND
jgi:hypothetical protein